MVILKSELFVVAGIWGVSVIMVLIMIYTKKNLNDERKYRAALFLLRLFPDKVKRQAAEKLKKIYPEEREELLLGKYCLQVIRGIYIAVLALSVIFPIYYMQLRDENVLTKGNYVERKGYGKGDRALSIKAAIESDEKEMEILVSELAYTDWELAEKQKQAQDYISKVYLGENTSADSVRKPLNLVKKVPDSAILVSWNTDGTGIVGESGEIHNNDLKEPVNVEMVAVLKYENIKKELSFVITVQPPDISQQELLWNRWKEKFDKINFSTREKRFLALPTEIDGHSVDYGEAESGKGYVLPCIMVLSVFIIPAIINNNIEKKLNNRARQIAGDYPDFIERFMLLISAGLTIKGAWYRILEEYQKKKGITGRKRYLYEEMLVTMRELEGGVGELKAYEMFGKRMGLLAYLKFSNLLTQNLRRGTADLLDILNYESVNALNCRKEQAKALGEEAGTKLLLPMMMNLSIVFGIIIYAAFKSM